MDKLRSFGWRQWLLILGLVLSLGVAGVFAVRAMQYVPRRQVDEPIRPWMTVPYIAHSNHVPAGVLYQALGLPTTPRDRRPIVAIARAQQRPVNALIAELRNAIIHARPPYPTPTPEPVRSTP
jgi:hypothetical protein